MCSFGHCSWPCRAFASRNCPNKSGFVFNANRYGSLKQYVMCLCFSVTVKVSSYRQWWACWNCSLLDWRVYNHPGILLRSYWSYTSVGLVWASPMTWPGSLPNVFHLYRPYHLALTIGLLHFGLINLSYVGGNTAARSETSILITKTKRNHW